MTFHAMKEQVSQPEVYYAIRNQVKLCQDALVNECLRQLQNDWQEEQSDEPLC